MSTASTAYLSLDTTVSSKLQWWVIPAAQVLKIYQIASTVAPPPLTPIEIMQHGIPKLFENTADEWSLNLPDYNVNVSSGGGARVETRVTTDTEQGYSILLMVIKKQGWAALQPGQSPSKSTN